MIPRLPGRLKYGWAFFDRVYCISLEERTDRRRQAETQFKAVGLSQLVEFVLVDRHPHNSEQGIYQSHLTCIEKGLVSGADNILIFEDDVFFQRFSAESLSTCTAFLAGNPDWKAFFLGCLVQRSRKTGYPSIRSVTYRSLAHAYAVNRPFAEVLATKPWQGVPYDAMLRRHAGGFFAIYPSVAFQSDSPSDNARHRWLDRFRRWCGGLARIQRANEWCHRYGRLLVVLHVLGLAAIVILAVWICRFPLLSGL
jgi:hypothetical protein